jgi:putative CocE/NonD family hydrolase
MSGGDPPSGDAVVAEYTRAAPDGTELSGRLFRPGRAGPDAPALLQRTPYDAPEDLDGEPLASMALDRGFAVVYEDTRGRGESGGEFRPWVHEATDGAAAVEWVADRPWSTGRVGTFGASSPGQLQLLAAAEQPAGLAAVAPMFTPSDLHRCDFFQDGAMSAMTVVTWSFGEWVAGHSLDRLVRSGRMSEQAATAARETLAAALERVPELVAHRPLTGLLEHVFADVDLPDGVDPEDVVPYWDAWTSRPTYDEFWRSFDVELRYDRIAVPGLHVTGWYELCREGTLTNYAGLRDRSPAPQHLVVGPWAHLNVSGELGELQFGSAASAGEYGVWETHLDFFETYVRGEPRGPFAASADRTGDDGRLVETVRTTVAGGEGDGEWVRHGDWPPAEAASERWFLTSGGAAATDLGDGRLTRRRPDKFEPVDEWTHDPTDPVPTRGGPLCCRDESLAAGAFDQREIERRGDVCTYTTPPLDRPLELAGPATATLTVATSAQDTDLTAKLVHVTEDGPAYNLTEGIRRARYRRGRDRVTPVVPDQPMQVTVDLWDVHHVVPRGDRLRLEVASSNYPRFDPHPGTVDPWDATPGDVRRAEQTLYHERDRESALTVVGREG